MPAKKINDRPVIICTAHRGVFFGYTADTTDKILTQGRTSLRASRMAIYWGTTRGVMELAETGPTTKSRISARADIGLGNVTAVFEVTPAAVTKWESA